MTPLLEIKQASRHFGGLHAVENFSGHVKRGERVGLIGPLKQMFYRRQTLQKLVGKIKSDLVVEKEIYA